MDDLVFHMNSAKATLVTVGGKGVNLTELVRAGFPVPAGFLISTSVYWAFVHANDLQEKIVTLATSGAGTDFQDVSVAIRQLFEHGSMPSEFATAIQQVMPHSTRRGRHRRRGWA